VSERAQGKHAARSLTFALQEVGVDDVEVDTHRLVQRHALLIVLALCDKAAGA
jgi:hypothetical protein